MVLTKFDDLIVNLVKKKAGNMCRNDVDVDNSDKVDKVYGDDLVESEVCTGEQGDEDSLSNQMNDNIVSKIANDKSNEEPVIRSQKVYGSTDRQENKELDKEPNKQQNENVRVKTYANLIVITECDKQLNTIPTKSDSNGMRMSVNELRYNLRKMWNRICNVATKAWMTNGISALASRIGKPMVMDDVITTMCKNGVGKVRYVEVSVQKPFPDDIEIVYKNGLNESCPKHIRVYKKVSDNEEQKKGETKKQPLRTESNKQEKSKEKRVTRFAYQLKKKDVNEGQWKSDGMEAQKEGLRLAASCLLRHERNNILFKREKRSIDELYEVFVETLGLRMSSLKARLTKAVTKAQLNWNIKMGKKSRSAHRILHNLFKSSIQATMSGEATKSGDKLQTFNLHVKANDIKQNKTHLTCGNCGMSRHTTDQCFELIGYPDWWNDGHKKGNKNRGLERGKASAANTGTDRKNSTGLGGMAATTVNEEDGSFSMSTTQNYNINQKQSWIFDCGATDTMTYDLSDFATSTKPTKSYIHTANGEKMNVRNGGTIEISPTLKLSNCLYVPALSHKLLSISHVTKELNCSVIIQPTFCILQDIRTGAIIGRGTERQGLYYVDELTTSGTVC
ncbi:hypothetical protein Tco_1183201 [Tanacetum coccineum]